MRWWARPRGWKPSEKVKQQANLRINESLDEGLVSIVFASRANTLTSGHTSWHHQNSPELTSNSWDFNSPFYPRASWVKDARTRWPKQPQSGTLLVGVCAQMFENLYKQFCLSVWDESLLHATVVILAGSCEHIFLTQKEIGNCTVEQLTSLCTGPAGSQPTYID